MADYNDITLGAAPVSVPVATEDTIIYASGGPLRFTSHQTPAGNTVGIPLQEGQAHLVKADNAITAWSDTGVSVKLVRTTA
ncbi:hypothetical protein PAF17_16085 [Paracoccus sp. Z330]|uniref:Uncharacterized protein n=1 Tax=Paracoccus onchidii TaxID=3017813 RepID=A0ABT4ZIX6_9RHOB|nr:hypothetical protein [Paracoccus onchidii]MDB6179012.1 hypothetical protein [Paracoccus onchidii]